MSVKMVSSLSILPSVSSVLKMDTGTILDVSVILATMLLIRPFASFVQKAPLITK